MPVWRPAFQAGGPPGGPEVGGPGRTRRAGGWATPRAARKSGEDAYGLERRSPDRHRSAPRCARHKVDLPDGALPAGATPVEIRTGKSDIAPVKAAPVTKWTSLTGLFSRCNSCRDTHREERHCAGQGCATRGAERRGAGLETGVPGRRAAGRSGGRWSRPYAPCGWVGLRHARRARAERTHTAWNAGLQTGTAALRAAPGAKWTSLMGRFSRCNSCRDTHREERHRAGQGCAMRGAERRGAGLETGVPGGRAAGRSGGRRPRPYAPCGWVRPRHAARRMEDFRVTFERQSGVTVMTVAGA